jgi:MoxR-like ATPase
MASPMPLPDPFFVIATQNPVDLAGTYPLPDSQLDRFLLRLHLGYPTKTPSARCWPAATAAI